ncbi:hypothetical protein CK203_095375 [Vitis vinifera]|uniref:Uncharacterized protein n=1 Tax=Vitis vinifera TaxID=29760 RepID=A0A438BTI3_VITVI|nr:hypothetical protein CK203_095375 [Vitis vinifera]
MRPIDDTITFPSIDVNQVLQPHEDTPILTLRANGLLVIYPRKSRTFVVRIQWSYINLPGQCCVAHPSQPSHIERVILDGRRFVSVIMGHAWIHKIKVIPSTYHQMVSYLTEKGQVNLLSSQLATRNAIRWN